MRARGFTHVSISATDLEESVRFYEAFFAMEEVPSPDFSGPVRWLRVGDLQLHLFWTKTPRRPGTILRSSRSTGPTSRRSTARSYQRYRRSAATRTPSSTSRRWNAEERRRS